MTVADHAPSQPAAAPPSVRRRLDEVVRRIRVLRVTAGVGRLTALGLACVLAAYLADRLLDLPLGVRALAGFGVLVLLAREAWRRIGRPLFRGPDRLDAARLVESVLDLQGRLVSALQLPAGAPGSLEHRLAEEAASLADARDLRSVLTAGPSLADLARGGAAAVVVAALIAFAEPHTDVFVQRWTLHDVPWPRDTHLELMLPARSPVHVLDPDGTLVASRGGTVSVQAAHAGRRPERVELVVEGEDGERVSGLSLGSGGRYLGHVSVRPGDLSLAVRGGDDDGRDNRVPIRVIDPPRLDDPVFRVEPPAYTGQPTEVVPSEGLVVTQGTTITVMGRPQGHATAATLWMLGSGESTELVLSGDGDDQQVNGAFVAEVSDTLSVVLAGEYGLTTPDPGQHALLVHEDRPPSLRVFAPARSDVKVTADAVVPVAVMAEDDHGIDGVRLVLGDTGGIELQSDDEVGAYRHVLDLAALELTGSVPYELSASDRRRLPGKGPQTARAAGRRIDVVDAAEVQRLLADRQLRLKESFLAVRERQQLALEAVDDLVAEPPAADDPDLVAAAVSQNQVTARLQRETRELCAILDETILDRLDKGPGAEAVLRRRVDDWRATPLDRGFDSAVYAALAADYAAGRFGRLDVVGRLLDMAALALRLTDETSPTAHELLAAARGAPEAAALARAREAQVQVLTGLDRLLERMDEWEDYQEVLNLVKTMIEDQRSLREASQRALTGRTGGN